MATLKPLHDRVIVERVEAEEKIMKAFFVTPLVIFLLILLVMMAKLLQTESIVPSPLIGKALPAFGSGKKLDNGTNQSMCVKAGDKVLFGKYSGQVVKQDGKELLVMREDDILAIVA